MSDLKLFRIDTVTVTELPINENVINQGQFYLDWLMDHKADFKWLVFEKLGQSVLQ